MTLVANLPDRPKEVIEILRRHCTNPGEAPDFCDLEELAEIIWNSCLLLDSLYESDCELDERSRKFLFNLRKSLEGVFPAGVVRPL